MSFLSIVFRWLNHWRPWWIPDKFQARALAANTVWLLFLWIMLYWMMPQLPPQVPWFYSLSQPQQQLIDKQSLPLFFSSVSLLVLLDWWLSALVYPSSRLAARCLLAGSGVAITLLALGLWQVYLITT